jgi:hypothetical protein
LLLLFCCCCFVVVVVDGLQQNKRNSLTNLPPFLI